MKVSDLFSAYRANPLLAQRDGVLKIISDNGLEVLRPNPGQLRVGKKILTDKWVKVEKSRQVGISTECTGISFILALVIPNYRVVVVAHRFESAEAIFRQHQTYYENLPPALKPRLQRGSTRVMVFENGSSIRVHTAGSPAIASCTADFLHLSEIAKWPDIKGYLTASLQIASKNAYVVIESTAFGLNDWFEIWESDNGFQPVFVNFLDDPRCRLEALPGAPATPFELQESQTLPPLVRNWWIDIFRTKCFCDINAMRQEHPTTSDQAFLSSGCPVLPPHLFSDDCREDGPNGWWWAPGHPQEVPAGLYALGIDIASGGGEPLDRSTGVLLDVTRKPYRQVGGWRGYISPSQLLTTLNPLVAYTPLIIPETNFYSTIVEELIDRSYPHIYCQQPVGTITGGHPTKLGWHTSSTSRNRLFSRLTSSFLGKTLDVATCDPRVLYECRNLVFDKSGRPSHPAGKHDDFAIALALALMGEEQYECTAAQAQRERPPEGIREKMLWELKHKQLWTPPEHSDDSDFELDGGYDDGYA